MSETLPIVYLSRHCETAWTVTGQYTGRTDLPLSPNGERNARRLGQRLRKMSFAGVFTSPLERVTRTCELAGFAGIAEVDADLVEWDYGRYERLHVEEILADRPDWQLFRDGCPGGESPEEVGVRADRVIRRVRAAGGDVLVFSSANFLRVLAARWLELEPGAAGRYLQVSPGSVSALGYDHTLSQPVIRFWNDDHDIAA